MAAQEWFESFFVQGRFAEQLERLPAERTDEEVAFIEDTLGLQEGARILDLCCGIGRHTVPLALRGYHMAGLDLDEAALEKAKQTARDAGVQIAWHLADMRDIPYDGDLDVVINWFSSWGYYETDDEDARVLAAVARALKPGGEFLLEMGNREGIFRRYREREWHEEPDGTLVLTRRELDLATSRNRVTEMVIDPEGRRKERWHRFRFYSLTELSRMLGDAGLAVAQVWGAVDGSPYGLATPRLILLARKPGGSGPRREDQLVEAGE